MEGVHPVGAEYEMIRSDGGEATVERGSRWELLFREERHLEAVSAGLRREAAIRSVMKIREVGREQAAAIVDRK